VQLLRGEVQLSGFSLQSAQLLAGLGAAVLHRGEVALQAVQAVGALTDLRSAGKTSRQWFGDVKTTHM